MLLRVHASEVQTPTGIFIPLENLIFANWHDFEKLPVNEVGDVQVSCLCMTSTRSILSWLLSARDISECWIRAGLSESRAGTRRARTRGHIFTSKYPIQTHNGLAVVIKSCEGYPKRDARRGNTSKCRSAKEVDPRRTSRSRIQPDPRRSSTRRECPLWQTAARILLEPK